LRNKPYCYHHNQAHTAQRSIVHKPSTDIPETVIHSMQKDANWMQREPLLAEYYNLKPGPLTLTFPPLEDRESIQVALSMVLSALAQKRIDAKEATPLLYGLQVASANAKDLHGFSEHRSVVELTVDEHGETLALDEDPADPFEGLYGDDDEDEDDEQEQADDEDESLVSP